MRLFFAICLNQEIKDKIYNRVASLKEACVDGRFSRKENLHLTLSFLGEVSPARLDELKKVLESVPFNSLELEFSEIGKFGRGREAIYWIGIKKNPEIYAIQKTLTDKLKENGFKPDDKPFKAHITLGRQVIMPDSFSFDSLNSDKVPSMRVDKISLMLSDRVNGALTYTELFNNKN